MGYWNGWSNYKEWAEVNAQSKKCNSCGEDFIPGSPRQMHCSYDDNPVCYWGRYDETISAAQWIKERGYTKDEFIKEWGIEIYNMLNNKNQ